MSNNELKYNLNHSNIVYSSDKWNPGLLYYDLKPIGDINV